MGRNAGTRTRAEPSSPAIELRGLTKLYGRHGVVVRAVDGLCLDVRAAELLAVVGPSGCGKTTTVRLTAGLERPNHGTVWIGGHDVTSSSPRRRHLAVVFQDLALYPHMTVRDNLGFALRGLDGNADSQRRRIRETVELLQLGALLGRRPGALSGGQRQRVALARALIKQPAGLLLDEPLAGLDAPARVHTRADLKALLRRTGTTALYVTHDQEEALALGDRVAVMNHGRVVQAGSPQEVFRRPIDRFVAGFIGSPGMNFLDGVLQHGSDRFEVHTTAGRVPVRVAPSTWIGRKVVVGIRPQALSPGNARSPLTAVVRAVEHLGNATHVHCSVGEGQPLVASLQGETGWRPGQRVSWEVDPQTVVLFEHGDRGRNLMNVDEASR